MRELQLGRMESCTEHDPGRIPHCMHGHFTASYSCTSTRFSSHRLRVLPLVALFYRALSVRYQDAIITVL